MQIATIPNGYTAKSKTLAGKTILITGAGAGIGRAAALSYANHGATVILLGRTVEKLESVYDEILASGGPKPAIFPMDLATAGESEGVACAGAIESEFSHLDGLLHNAGIVGERRPIESAGYSSWQEVMQVNVNSAFLLTRHLLPLLKEAAASSIVFTSSSVGRTGKAFWGAYAASKFATEGLMQVLACEMESTSNVRVNCLNPGATNTAMRRTAYPGEDPASNLLPEAIMTSYLYLMSDDSLQVTGQTFDAQP
jgi:NAD(P)-dependent dehydrogenase (short-subunit alcohol dehydrogenase family)